MFGWILSILLIIMAYMQGSKLPSIWFAYHYSERLDYFRVLNKGLEKGGIVFLGDSITEHFLVSEFFPKLPVMNRGISGDTTVGVIRRLKESVYELQPSVVVLLIGTNDLGNGKRPKAIATNINQLIQRIQKHVPNTRIYLQSVYPVRVEKGHQIKKTIVGKRHNKDIQEINRGLRLVAKKRGITYMDIYSHLIDQQGNLKACYAQDGLHLSPEGYEQVARILRPYLGCDANG